MSKENPESQEEAEYYYIEEQAIQQEQEYLESLGGEEQNED